jgi:rhamnose transport system permease protein
MNNASEQALRTISDKKEFSVKKFFLQWEWLLFIILILVVVINSSISPNFLDSSNLLNAVQLFLDKAILVYPMMLIILLGEIDISIASTMALSAVIMGVSFQAGAPMGASVAIALVTGALCGFINGIILAKFKELASMIVSLSTMIIYRGIASTILEDRAITGFPSWFSNLGWGNVFGMPVILIFFIVETAFFIYLIHSTKFGRSIYAMGFNIETSKYSGISTERTKIIVFTIMGVLAGVAALFLASKMGSVRPSMAKGYELDVIAMVVLGGVSTSGGRGRAIGVLLSVFIIGFLRYGLGIVNVPSQVTLVIIGALLILAVAIPNLRSVLGLDKVRMKKKKGGGEKLQNVG